MTPPILRAPFSGHLIRIEGSYDRTAFVMAFFGAKERGALDGFHRLVHMGDGWMITTVGPHELEQLGAKLEHVA